MGWALFKCRKQVQREFLAGTNTTMEAICKLEQLERPRKSCWISVRATVTVSMISSTPWAALSTEKSHFALIMAKHGPEKVPIRFIVFAFKKHARHTAAHTLLGLRVCSVPATATLTTTLPIEPSAHTPVPSSNCRCGQTPQQ